MARGFNYAPGASPEVLEAQQPGLHRAHIMALGSSRNVLVRAAVAARTDCPLGLMVTLAHDYHADVRSAVARNPAAQRTVMAYLAADRNQDVVLAVLENPSLPADILEELAFHKKAGVRAAAAHRLDAGLAPVVVAEDSHTPELAEHVQPRPPEGPGPEAASAPPAAPAGAAPAAPAADNSAVAPQPQTPEPPGAVPNNVVDLATGSPVVTQFAPVSLESGSVASAASVYPEPFPMGTAASTPAVQTYGVPFIPEGAAPAGAPAVPNPEHPAFYSGPVGGAQPAPDPSPTPAEPTQAAEPEPPEELPTPTAAPTRTAPIRGFKFKD